MRWRGDKQSKNIEDRTGSSSGGGLPSGNLIKGGGIGTIIVLALVFLFSGGDLSSVLNSLSPGTGSTTPQPQSEEMIERKEFVSVVFAHLEDYWGEEFAEAGKSYQQPTMVFFSGNVQTACGPATSAVGPFYCPGDQDVYLDLSFMDELATDFDASGDFAMAYVVAHEVGHHVQQQLGVSKQVQALRNKLSEQEYNQYQVRMELQADYYAGAWAKYIEGQTFEGQPILEIGDIDEALVAANSIGDDTLQMKAQGYVVPERYTHGTSQQRKSWFARGYEYGDFQHGDTFNTRNLNLN
ncbi:neutral zinc metallopeptidase [uncultured Vagococcus sp.]|uniref:KPN_02809 family neutral zinc metallopeptidase n=1 Tax=uncultured Vagococcus sp. TaxID=189676 RepID=UPI0028D8FD26|nr:neutral zinc metallopeptidase [uncultured Vagococcus sp.]